MGSVTQISMYSPISAHQMPLCGEKLSVIVHQNSWERVSEVAQQEKALLQSPQTQLDPWNSYGGKRELTPKNCLLTSVCVMRHTRS